MKPDELQKLYEDDQMPIVLDVRSGLEYQAGHIPGAVHAPLSALKSAVDKAVSDKSRQIVLVCEHGPRAQLGKMALMLRGFKRIELLDGHMSKWRRYGRPMQVG